MNKHTPLLIVIGGFVPIIVIGYFLLANNGSSDTALTQSVSTAPSGVTTVEIAYLNHSPLRGILADIDTLLEKYGEKISITRYDFNSPQGEAFVQAKDLTDHTPLAIFINGSMDFTVGGQKVKFYSFPRGEGTLFASDGDWTMDDLQQVLDEIVENNS